jgi:uncharacterized protein YecE (DUF72 family)
VENNGTFYRLPARDTFASWRDRVPGDFAVTVKASRYLTHVRRLREVLAAANAALSASAQRITGRITGNGDVYPYFNNDQHGAAPRDAARLAATVVRRGGHAARAWNPDPGRDAGG